MSVLMSCKETDNQAKADQDGITVSKSADIEVVKQANIDLTKYDLAKLRTHYTANAKVHDNLNVQPIDTNLSGFIPLKKAGVKFAIEGKPVLFEILNNKPVSRSGESNYVETHYTLSVTRGSHKSLFNLNQVFTFKAGKIAEEWDTYDTAPISNLLK